MRRKTPSEGRTTLYMVDRDAWKWAKEKASALKYSSTSEYMFDLLKKQMVKSSDETFLRALEKRYELKHYTVGMMADFCDLTRKEIIDKMSKYGFSIDDPDIGSARRRVHDLLYENGIKPLEDHIYSQLIQSHDNGLMLLPKCFIDSTDFINELTVSYEELLYFVGENRKVRKWIDDLIMDEPVPDVLHIFKKLSLNKKQIELSGGIDWRSTLLYFACVELFYRQMGLLLKHFFEKNQSYHAQQKILTKLDEFFSDTIDFWGGKVQSSCFRDLLDIVTQNMLPTDHILPPRSLKNKLRLKGPSNEERTYVDYEKSYFPIEINDGMAQKRLPPEIKDLETIFPNPANFFDYISYFHENSKAFGTRIKAIVIEREKFQSNFKEGNMVPSSISYSRYSHVEVIQSEQ